MSTLDRNPKLLPHFRHGWPVGLRLVFKQDADLAPKYKHLVSTPVLVTHPAAIYQGDNLVSQYVYTYYARKETKRYGRVYIEDLEFDPNPDPVLKKLNNAILHVTPDIWFRHRKSNTHDDS